MATMTISNILLLLFVLPAISAAGVGMTAVQMTNFITTKCNATLYPDICYSTINPKANEIAGEMYKLARVAVEECSIMTEKISHSFVAKGINGKPNPQSADQVCIDNFKVAIEHMTRSLNELNRLNVKSTTSMVTQLREVQTWLTDALANQETCAKSLASVKSKLLDGVETTKKFVSIATAIINQYAQEAESQRVGPNIIF